MNHYLLDTDTLSLLQHGHAAVVARVNRTSLGDMSISTVTIWEQMQGWQSAVKAARDNERIALAHNRLVTRLMPTWCRFGVLAMTEPALDQFAGLVSLRLNVGMMDLRIAAVALDAGLTVVSRNLRDFRRVPGLNVEDWSI